MRKYFLLLLAVCALGSCALAAPKKTPAKQPLPVWKPAPALLQQLAPQSELPFGTVRLPRGYELLDRPFSASVGTGLAWGKGAPRYGLNYAIQIIQIPLEETDAQDITLEKALSTFMVGLKVKFDNPHYTPAKYGVINGVKALRSEWSGTYRSTQVKLQGTNFILKDATDVYIIQVGHRINSPIAEQRLAEAAALTFKIQSQD